MVAILHLRSVLGADLGFPGAALKGSPLIGGVVALAEAHG